MQGTRKRLSPLLVIVGILLVAGLVWGLAGAVAGSPSATPSSQKITLKIGWLVEPDNLNPFIGYETSSYEIWALNYSFLFMFDLHGNAVPQLATETPTQQNGGISPDGKTWTIHMQPNAKWQDGQPLTADDAAWTLNYIIKNQMYAFAVGTLNMKDAVAVNATTLQINCTKPKADMLRSYWPVLPKHIWQNVKPNVAGTSYQMPYPIVGSGPFQTVEFKKGAYVRMEKNPYYFGPEPAIDEILFLAYQTGNSMEADLTSGVLDAAQGVPEAQFPTLQRNPDFTAVAYNYFNWDYMDFNCYSGKSTGNPVLLDVNFRKAINYAIDKQELAKLGWQGYAQPGTTIMTPDSWTNPDFHYQPPADQIYPFDLATAQQKLADAGYKKVNGQLLNKQGKPITLRLMAPSDWQQHVTEAKLVAGWLKQLGIAIKLEIVDGNVVSDKVYNYAGAVPDPDFDLVIWDWDGYLDPGQTLASYSTAQIGGWNEPGWSNAQFDKLNDQQATTLDPNARKDQIWRMQQIMYDQTPIIVFTYYDYLQAYNTAKWEGWQRTLDGRGPAIYTSGSNIDTYLSLRPKAEKAGKSSLGLIVLAAVAAVVVIVVVLVLVRRRKPQAVED